MPNRDGAAVNTMGDRGVGRALKCALCNHRRRLVEDAPVVHYTL
jgi:hypothetical protein